MAVCCCSSCGAELSWTGELLRCQACATTYQTSSGVPILIPPDTMRPSLKQSYSETLSALPGPLRRLAARYRVLTPTLTYKSPKSQRLITDFVASFAPGALVLNVGSGETRYGPDVLNLDIDTFPGVDLVGVAERLPLRGDCCDGVILKAVIQHVRLVGVVLDEIRRVLKSDGLLLIEAPFIQGYHPHPSDYRRYTEEGLRAELEEHGFDVESSGVVVGPASGLAWVAADFLALLLSGRSERAFRMLRLATRFLAAPIKHADRLLESHPMATFSASGVWARARRVR